MHWRWSLRASGISNTECRERGRLDLQRRGAGLAEAKGSTGKAKPLPRRQSRKVIGNIDNVSVQFELQPGDLLRANLWWFSKRWLIRFVYAVNLTCLFRVTCFMSYQSEVSAATKRFKPFNNYSVKNWRRKRASRVKLDRRLSAKLADRVTCPKDN
jgi:hypothetical protein